jgi:hypothetical protein
VGLEFGNLGIRRIEEWENGVGTGWWMVRVDEQIRESNGKLSWEDLEKRIKVRVRNEWVWNLGI